MKIFFPLFLLLVAAGTAQAQTCPTSSQLDADITGASVSDVISLDDIGSGVINCPEVDISQTWAGGRLVFSDSPEYPTASGKLYEDTGLAATAGTDYNRVFVYHVNNANGPSRRFSVIVKNTSGSSATLQVQKHGTAGPSTSFLYAGKKAYERWTDSSALGSVNVAAGATVRLDTAFDTTNVAKGYLLHGIWDYSMSSTHAVTVCFLKQSESPTGDCPGMSVLARDSHDRGTFDYADKVYDTAATETILTSEGVVQFPIGGNGDEYVTGYDNAVDPPTEETLQGNFGVLYRMHLSTEDDDAAHDHLGLCVNPRGGTWGGAARIMAGVVPTTNTTALLPAGTGSLGDNTKCVVEARYEPSDSLSVWQQFMPVGGAALPVRIVFVPH